MIAGDDKGKTGRVIEIFPERRRAMVEGVNIVIKHSKPTTAHPQGGRIEMEASMHISNLMLVDPKTSQPTRVGRVEHNGKLVRVSVKTKEVIK